MSGGWVPCFTCHCGKKAYTTRADARVVRKHLPGGKHLNAYLCQHAPPDEAPRWHLGALPDRIRHGEITRDEATQAIRPPRHQETA